MFKLNLRNTIIKTFLFIVVSATIMSAQNKREMTLQDIMKFKQIKSPQISDNGNWITFLSVPDRGNAEAVVQSTEGNKVYIITRGGKTVFSENEKWAGITIVPDFAELEKEKKDKPKNDFVLLNTSGGDTVYFKEVQNFDFSKNSSWLAYSYYKKEEKESGSEEKKETKKSKKPEGTLLVLRNLNSGEEIKINDVAFFTFDSLSSYMAYTTADTSGQNNGLFLRDLSKTGAPEITVDKTKDGSYTHLTWNKNNVLAFVKSVFDKEGKPGKADIFIWDGKTKLLTASKDAPAGWFIPAKNQLRWTKDAQRLFFGYKPDTEKHEEKDTAKKEDIYNIDKIADKSGIDVWHWNDPLIKTHEKEMLKERKDYTYPSVYLLKEKKVVLLTNLEIPFITAAENPDYILSYSDIPYQKEITWDDRYSDYYVVNLKTGSRQKAVTKNNSRVFLSPEGKFVLYYENKNWFLYNIKTAKTVNLTEKLNVSFANEDHDTPSDAPPHGMGSWTEGDKHLFLYDKYDIWKFSTQTGEAFCLTDGYGRKNELSFRIVRTDREKEFVKENENLLLNTYHQLKKHFAFYEVNSTNKGVKKLLEENKKFSFAAKAKNSDKYLYTRESYEEFPDLWVSSSKFNTPKKLTDYGKQTDEFWWGTAELVEFTSADGLPLQGVFIKPTLKDEDGKFPVIVYYYEISSDRLYEFPDMVINHRPNFAYYASQGYAVYMPDIKFEIGRPGLSAVKCLTPAVQKIIDMGLAEPKAIGLHGHSWGGYQTAYVVTQTDQFACAIAGAPVSNMTSAYGGIRWGTGLARQFQYEKTQSRIGLTLWEGFHYYIDNSPLFFADRINTPLLLMHGDIDDAVPWYQSIELYLAMRRLNKDCIFLQYRDEPHHPKKYPNKLDYTIRMKEYFDFYLKKLPAAEWILKGIPYTETK